MTCLPQLVRESDRRERRDLEDLRHRLASVGAYQFGDGTLQVCDGVERWIETDSPAEVRR